MSSWTIKEELEKVKADEASSPKGPWSYAPLEPEQARWFWTKPPFTRRGAAVSRWS